MRVGIAAGFGAVVTAAVCGVLPAVAQDAGSERPVIGLVLSGGGARGGAHLGIVKALEEMRVPIHVAAGTSIGAAIAGLHASGMSIEELEDFVYGIDWDAAFLNETPRRLKSFRRKREDDLFLLQQRPGIDTEGFSLPLGVGSGQVIDTVMARVTLPVAAIDDFDNLAIPFRAVATDLETGDAVILGTGNLGRAIRASMTVPAILTPIEIDGRMLVDGGLVNNLPVDIAHDLGAERIIAVDISDKLRTRDELESVVAVTGQLTAMLTVRGTEEQVAQLAPEDILLVPEFTEEFSSTSFERLPETIETGYAFAMANRELFEPYALSEEEYAAHRAALPDPRTMELPTIDFVRVGVTAPLSASIVESRLLEVETGQTLDVDALETSLNRVYGLGVYQNIRYAVVGEPGGRTGLDLDFIERSWGPGYGQLGLRYTAASDEDVRFGFTASYFRPAINERGGEWRATMQLGDEPAFLADLYQPLGRRGLYFINPALRMSSEIWNVYRNDEVAAELRMREGIFELGGGRELMDWAEVRGGFRVGAGDMDLRVGDPAAVPYDGYHRGTLFARFSVDTLDSISFPREGTFSTFEWRGTSENALGADADFDQLLISTTYAKSWSRHTLLTRFRYDTTVSGQVPIYSQFRLGGFLDLSGFNENELTGPHATRLGASYYRRVGDLELFPAFVGINVEVGNTWQSRGDISLDRSVWAGALWAGVDTPVGPVFFAWGSAEGGDDAFYVSLGRLF